MKDRPITYERWRLILKHDMVNEEGKSCQLDNPIIVDHLKPNGLFAPSDEGTVNDMIDTMLKKLWELMEG